MTGGGEKILVPQKVEKSINLFYERVEVFVPIIL